jgi:ATP-dependent Clp protease ATP-binding subunit ClpC
MFERYTEKAKRGVFFARYECSQLGSLSIESEHLLLGVLRENQSLGKLFSVEVGTSLMKHVKQRTPAREKISTSVELPLSEECKPILTYAAEEADQLSHKFIGTEHLFLGILRESSCFAARLLQERGVSLDAARTAVGNKPLELGRLVEVLK